MKKKTRRVKYDDLQIKNGALEQEGKFIAAQIKTMRGYEAAAEEKAGVELKKAQDHRATVEQRLAEVHAKCKADGFKAFKAKWCPDFGRTKLYQILAIGSGKKTREQIRAEGAKRQAKSQARLKAAAASSSVTDASASSSVMDTSAGSSATDTSVARSTGNDIDPAASKNERVAFYARGATSPASKSTAVDLDATIAEKDGKSKEALAEYMAKLDGWMEVWTTIEKQKAFEALKFHPKMVGVSRRAA